MLKYKIYVFIMLLIGIVTFNLVTAKTNNLLLLGKVIYIDPGHPSFDKPNVIVTSCTK